MGTSSKLPLLVSAQREGLGEGEEYGIKVVVLVSLVAWLE